MTSKCQSIGELGTLYEKKFGKNLTMPKKTEREDPIVSPGNVCYAEKKKEPFWYSFLGQQVKFEIL